MKVIVPPIKSQGIKTKLVPWILSQIPEDAERWIEPFMGTGVVGFNSGFEVALMADINPHLVRFYEGLRTDEITPDTVREYLDLEGKLLSQSDEAGWAHYRAVRTRFNTTQAPLDFMFLNRAGFNGMIRFSKKGGWNIPFCKKPDRFIGMMTTKIVNQVARVRNVVKPGWRFSVSHFRDMIKEAGPNDIIYCDPPYHGRNVDYFQSWSDDDEAELAALLKATSARFILSTWHHNDFRTNESLARFWADFQIVTREHFYHAGAKEANRRPMIEALVMNFAPKKVIVEEPELDEGDGIEAEAAPVLAEFQSELGYK